MISQIIPDTCRSQEISLSNRREAIGALVEARKDKHMTLLDFECISGVSWDAVRLWEKGRREPTMGLLVAAAETLGFEIILRRQDQDPPVEAKQPDPNQFSFLDQL